MPNGNFEDPPIAPDNGRITFFAGDTYSTWSVLAGSIDLLGPNYSNFTLGNPNGGSQFIDLSGFTPGTISTTLNGLMPGSVYTIVLWYAKNPGGPSATCNIQVAGGAWLNSTWTSTNNGGDIWLEKCFTFTAGGTTAELRLIGSSPQPTAGMLLDDITMWKCPMDLDPPVAGNPPVTPLFVECSDPIPNVADPQFTDDCSSSLMESFSEEIQPEPCLYSLLRTWVSEDECGNSSTISQLVTIVDTQSPAFTTLPQDMILSCGEDYNIPFFSWLANHGGALAIDNCDSDVTWSSDYTLPPNGLCGITPVTFTVMDDCGNVATAEAYFIIEDFEPPLLSSEAEDMTVLCSDNAAAEVILWLQAHGGAQASDPCGPVIWSNNFMGSLNDPVIEVTFTATDACQNSVETTAFFYQPEITDTIFQTGNTCDPQLAGSDTTLLIQGNCEFITIYTTTYTPPDTTHITAFVCDSTMQLSDTLFLSNAYGCDSIVYISNLFIAPDTTLLSYSSCDSSQVGLHVNTVSNSYGCDSTIITNITFALTDTTMLFGVSCNQNESGIFSQNLVTALGCDSVVITQVTFTPLDTIFLFGSSCNPTETGFFTNVLLTSLGCDSVVVTAVNLLPSDSTFITDFTCDEALAGVFTQSLTNQFGCDSIITETVFLNPKDTTLLSSQTCDSSQTGVFIQSLINQFGCDSTIIHTIELTKPDTTLLQGTNCDPAQTGIFVQILSNQIGCDSVVIETITYVDADTTNVSGTSCDPVQAGIFVQHLTSNAGCDSVVITNISLLPTDSVFIYSASCDLGSTGVFMQVYSNQFGCDSTVIETISLLQTDTTLLTGSNCDPAQTGIFTQVLSNQFGCDSTIIESISLLPTDTILLSSSSCDPTQTGVFTQVLSNQFGCDSTIIETISLLSTDTILLSSSSCDPAQTGVFTQVLSNQFGCDSTIIETISLLPTDTTYLSSISCDSTQTGIFTFLLSNQFGCDSVVVNDIQPVPLPQVMLEGSDYNGTGVSCAETMDGFALAVTNSLEPISYNWSNGSHGQEISNLGEGNYSVTITDANGCSASATLSLSAPLPLSLMLDLTDVACDSPNSGSISVLAEGGTAPLLYSLNGSTYQQNSFFNNLTEGNYTISVADANSCLTDEPVYIDAPTPILVSLGNDITIYEGETANIQAEVNLPIDSLTSIFWSVFDPNCINCLSIPVSPDDSEFYYIQVVSNDGCSDADTIQVIVKKREHIYIPNVFSPNDDGINDVFMIFSNEGSVNQVITFQVFDRWGDKVFQLDNFSPNLEKNGWDGTFNGKEMNPGVFVWLAQIQFEDGSTTWYKGDVTLTR